MRTPIVLLMFNRPDTTQRVFDVIRSMQPQQLFVIADGPRSDRPHEAEKCANARAVVEQVDWDCQVFKNYSDLNLGCAKRVASGLDWVFAQVETAIILEDDCVPHPSFFQFCQELLDRYADDERIMAISGQNIQFGQKHTPYSYYFSRYCHCWGWASWRRAWKHFDFEMKLWPAMSENHYLNDILIDPRAVKYWTKIFQATHDGHINSWAYRWMFACWVNSGLTALPNVNLISNIGFGVEASHTKATSKQSLYANIPTEAVQFPLQHPPFIVRQVKADQFSQNTLFHATLQTRVRQKIKRTFG
ncbi:glycosyltransferase family 2 protein [Oculatella sp. LEGE 06141]|uniref:glycosyltransferase family 2 protein n=1 Tax=Oculatella sp. LEGE 06141 TaxID=1828648 RepID=UPI00187E166E|nr:glycosyltransferase family 2 protein [Oculatella sp. LEGE 06141]MBE9178847.1 glycosyltransferase family 2 protein [Oculatella sp. LEGE 06141]